VTDILERDAMRGRRAEQLLADELVTEIFETMRAEYIKAWEDSPARDSEGRERLWQAVQIVGKVRTHLQSMVGSGSLAKAEIDRMARGGR
jgi:transposase